MNYICIFNGLIFHFLSIVFIWIGFAVFQWHDNIDDLFNYEIANPKRMKCIDEVCSKWNNNELVFADAWFSKWYL